jgi:hypothetical protein
MIDTSPSKVVEAEVFRGGLVIRFEDQSSAYFPYELLYACIGIARIMTDSPEDMEWTSLEGHTGHTDLG